ncbi:N-acetyl-anhydromuranmyl-L-alanine amidase [Idiomarina xiamenensis 10-D-4]|uniref:1,6-anhydro-N-acetylmuramyl-L-alanine amidase AmpD n=2 Tax=Idiomarina xiamenensis TaxID=1207041 RepID=K2KSF3_9GAMM|nr:N-acetyl-anhydromuranmyl-L-alanine amidase [Idiomarina xiamenensis 10-D-4]
MAPYPVALMLKSFNLKNHRLLEAEQRSSPHYDQRPDSDDISLLVIHGISLPAGEFGQPYIDQLFMGELQSHAHPSFAALEGLRVSAHCLIRRDGQVIQYVAFDQRAWHAGRSHYAGRRRCNDFAIGIELEGTDNSPYSERQYQALQAVTACLLQQYPKLNWRRIVGHQHIAPGRKTDPGAAFDWAHYLAPFQPRAASYHKS